MRAHHIMTKDLVAVTPHTTIEEAAKIMLRMHISGLPVVDEARTERVWQRVEALSGAYEKAP